MTDLRTAAQQALDFIVATNKSSQFWRVPGSNLNKTVTALRAALAELVQEPVWIQPDHLQKARQAPFLCRVEPTRRFADFVPLYATQPQRKPLTRDEAMQLVNETAGAHWCDEAHLQRFCAAIERAHGIGE